jgi:hypothetical protein
MAVELRSARHDVASLEEAIELYHAKGWTDGLPVIPPTEERVRAFVEAAGRGPQEVLGVIRERARAITVEKVAINAVMAGCLPAYMPVLVAAVEAMATTRFNLHACAASTGGSAPLLIVNGPIVKSLGFNAGVNVFGQGWRANATVGRAIRLIIQNVCAGTPGVMDKSTLGHPGKFSYCIAENEDGAWAPLHVERGLSAGESAVTVFAGEGPHYVRNDQGGSPEAILLTVADVLASANQANGCYVVVLCPEHMQVIVQAGWSKKDIRTYLHERAARSVAALKRGGRVPGIVEPKDETTIRRIVETPDDLLVVVAGGSAGGFSAVVPPWAGGRSSLPETRAIRVS